MRCWIGSGGSGIWYVPNLAVLIIGRPNQIFGNQNSGDVTFSDGESTFTIYRRTIKYEYAQIIDSFFSMFGYKVNSVKVPNITGRSNWNYVKTIDCNFDGNIPQVDIDDFIFGDIEWHESQR